MTLAGARIRRDIVLDGFDMLPVLQGRMKSRRTEMFWKSRHSRAARVGEFKWVEAPELSGLFDLSRDPGEKNDLTTSQPETLSLVKSRWKNWMQEMEASAPRGPFRNF